MDIVQKTLLSLFVFFFSLASHAESSDTATEFAQAYKTYQAHATENNWAESLPYAKSAYHLGIQVYGENNVNTASLSYNYGLNLLKQKNKVEAAKVLKRTLSYYEKAYDENSIEIVPVLLDLGRAKSAAGKAKPTIKLFKRALKINEQHYGKSSVDYAVLSIDIGLILGYSSHSKRAKKYLSEGHKILLKKVGPTDMRTGLAAFHLGKFELGNQNYDTAVHYLNETLSTFSVPGRPSNTIEMATHGFLVHGYEKLNQPALATQHCLAIGRMTPVTDIQEYQPLVKIAPRYPLSALKTRTEGYVTVEYDVDEQGFVRNPVIIDRSNGRALFNKTSLEAAKKFRYAPAFKNGVAVATQGVKNKFNYTMTN